MYISEIAFIFVKGHQRSKYTGRSNWSGQVGRLWHGKTCKLSDNNYLVSIIPVFQLKESVYEHCIEMPIEIVNLLDSRNKLIEFQINHRNSLAFRPDLSTIINKHWVPPNTMFRLGSNCRMSLGFQIRIMGFSVGLISPGL